MATVEKSININVPVKTAYDQWTQFESFPEIMEGVTEVKQLNDKELHWKMDIAGQEREFDVEIVEQIPDHRIAWKSKSGVENAGDVTFRDISTEESRVTLQFDYNPKGFAEKAGEITGVVERKVQTNLEHFKRFLEQRGSETGAWRGEIQ